jgi:hypothetical protein
MANSDNALNYDRTPQLALGSPFAQNLVITLARRACLLRLCSILGRIPSIVCLTWQLGDFPFFVDECRTSLFPKTQELELGYA